MSNENYSDHRYRKGRITFKNNDTYKSFEIKRLLPKYQKLGNSPYRLFGEKKKYLNQNIMVIVSTIIQIWKKSVVW